jgi:capsular polysaccharide biosynthesis protein
VTEPRFGTVLARGWWLIGLFVLACVALAVIVTRGSEKVYEATALLRVDRGATPGSSTEEAFSAQEASKSLAGTYATTLASRSFLARIAPEVAGGSYDAAELERRTDAESVPETAVVQLSARAGSPEAAEALAQDVAAGFLAALREDARAQVVARRADLQRRIASLDQAISVAGSGSVEALRQARTDLTTRLGEVLGASSGADGVSLSAPPDAADEPVAPRPVLNIVAALLVGLVGGFGLAWVRERLTPRPDDGALPEETHLPPAYGSPGAPPPRPESREREPVRS